MIGGIGLEPLYLPRESGVAHGGEEPGLIWIALEAPGVSHARGFRVSGERDRVVRWAQQAGLDLVRRSLDGSSLPVSETTV